MINLQTYKVDLDYEASLFNPGYVKDSPANQKIIREFEYVFFLIQKEKSVLKNVKSYEKNYLNELENLGFVIPRFDPLATEYECWWGHHHNTELERKLNSKLSSAEIAAKNNWGFYQGAIVKNLDELRFHLQKHPQVKKWIIKHPYSFSGIGHSQFSIDSFDELVLTKILVDKVLLEPVYDRVFDIGTTFEIANGTMKKWFMVENFNSKAGGFKGGAGSNGVDKFKKYIFEKYSYPLDELEKITQEIAETYLGLGALSNIQIDSFIYQEDGELKLYPLVEVNYRKTMGLVIQSLAEKYSEANVVEWRVESAKKVKTDPLTPDWIKLSPEGNSFHSFFRKI
jgi:hypothetical protein